MAAFDHGAGLIACRNLLATLQVCTTGSTSLSSTTSGYARAAGSFLTDGFRVGMEITPSGFSANDPQVIKTITATAITIDGTITAEAANTGRSLSVLQPEFRLYPNVSFNPSQASGHPYTEEEWLPGPSNVETLGQTGATVVAEPIYVVKWYGLAGKGDADINACTDAVLRLFAPGTAITLSTGDVLTVKRRPAPFKSQITNPSLTPGRALVTVTIPMWAQTTL